MYRLLVHLLLSVCGLGLADYLFDGVRFDHFSTLFGAAVLLAFANGIIKPLLILLTLPITVLSLGLFLLVINAAVLGLVAALLSGFYLDGFMSALLTWFIVAVTQGMGNLLLGKKKSS
ncbi:phage holin family protein [Agitococcus lubricus]|uniref:Putative membrane protein n=1 Tax=Agitococcus lubricus TaxID=1077255 RepID=A0A2T5IYI9_9GAMM|nr:phage holin family protein [Agitococcus lubricus]PTQ88997.1 putative membrane protein [Agitococcus lubricus]